MKPTPTSATPAMKIINGKKCVRVLDLAKAWGTSTATILATDKPHAVPKKYIHRIDGRAWCQLDGLRKRADAVKDRKSSYISRQIIDFLDSLNKPTEPKPEPAATDLGTAALIADARRTASQALKEAHSNTKLIFGHTERLYKLEDTVNKLKPCRDHVARHQSASATVVGDKNTGRINDLTTRVHGLDVRVKALEHDVPQLLHAMCPKERVQELSGKLDNLADAIHGTQGKTTADAAAVHVVKQTADTALNTATQAADLAQENADLANENKEIIGREVKRLTHLAADVDKMRKKAHARHDDTMARIIQTERNQRDTAARIATLEEHARAIDWALAAVAILGVVGRVIRLLRRR